MTALEQAAPRTTVPSRPEARRQQQPRPIAGIRLPDVLAVGGALAAAVTTTGLLWTQLAPFSGIIGYVVLTWCLFVLFYAVLVSLDQNRTTMRDRVAAVVAARLRGRIDCGHRLTPRSARRSGIWPRSARR